MTTKDSMYTAMGHLKVKFGTPLAKELVMFNGVLRMVDTHPSYYGRTVDIAERMLAAPSQKEAAEVLIKAFYEWAKVPTPALCDMAHQHEEAKRLRGVPAPTGAPLPSPNEVIQWLLQIAAAAEVATSTSMNGVGPKDVIMPLTSYRKLSDELASLEVLPYGYVNAPGSARAAEFLKSFTTGLSVSMDPDTAAKLAEVFRLRDKVEVMAGELVRDSAKDIADYIKQNGVPKSIGGVVSQATFDAVLVGESTERIRRGTPMGKAPQTLGLHRDFRAEQFDKIVHAFHQQFGAPGDMPVEDITAEVISYIHNSSKMCIPHGHPVTIGAPCAIYEVGYVDNLLNAVADLATDGKRFRTLSWMFKCEETISNSVDGLRQAPQFADYTRACEIMEGADSNNTDEFGPALDAVRRAGLVPDSNDKLDSAMEAEGVRVKALSLAHAVVTSYRTVWRASDDGSISDERMCKHCGFKLPDTAEDTLDEHHAAHCAVITARQLIEDQS